jgi:serine-protein kinase ATM
LRDCATVFRLAVELGVRKVTSTTANAIIDHVVDTLPVAGEAYCQPLTDDYLKILRAILEHAPHVEHLRNRKWCTLTDFLVQGISHHALDGENPSSGTNESSPSLRSKDGRVRSFRVSQGSAVRPTRQEAGRPAEDLFFCLDCLTAATNAPTISRATLIVDMVIRFFDSASSGGSLHQIAFSCMNNILSKVVTEDTRLTQRVVLEILPTIRRLWSSKNTLLRDEMLITLVLSRDTITALPKSNRGDDTYSSLSNLLEVMSAEYSRRNEREILQLDDVLFMRTPKQQVMSLENFCVLADHIRGTFNWATISVIAFITLTLSRFSQMVETDRVNDTPSKRRKLASGVDDVFRQSLSAPSLVKTRALQTIPFLLNESPALSENFLHLIVQFTNQILDEDPSIAAWTMIAISR